MSRYRLVSSFISSFENRLEELAESKSAKFDVVLSKLRTLTEAVVDNRSRRERAEGEINKHIVNVEKNCLKLL
ncbi:MAG: hypothetical protein JST59_01545 [Actinobacteria bacterium]|nr:hypothetical protein [Actinomycetota bacterium]